jgi:DNA-binding XRE family transcriptional regulator
MKGLWARPDWRQFTVAAIRRENAKRRKLNPEQVAEIRARGESQSKLARRFGVSKATIGFIQSGRLYAHELGR